MIVATNAALFCEAIAAQTIKTIPFYREYIPDADPIEAKKETEKKCKKLKGAVTLGLIETVKIGEVVSPRELVERSGLSKRTVGDRLRRLDSFYRQSRGQYKRIK